jgi:Protein of unknown function (DUF3106)
MKYKISNSVLCVILAAMAAYAESPPRAAKAPRIGAAGPGPAAKSLGAPAVDRLVNMTPVERKKALQNLPPDRRKQLEERLRQYDRLTPAQKAKLYGQYQNFSGLSAEQQAHLRRLFQRFNNFPPERQGALRAEVQKMQILPATDRRARMNSDEFRNRYNQREQALLAELAKAVPSN